MSAVERAFAEIEAYVRSWREDQIIRARGAMEDTAADGAERVREIIHLSVTPWGVKRTQGIGGEPRQYPGRIESGDMIGAVGHRVEQPEEDVLEARWGWEDPDEYYLIQEYGFDEFDTKIAPMQSLATSLDEAEVALQERLQGRL